MTTAGPRADRLPGSAAPLILTGRLDAEAHAILDGLRRRHFPAELNHLAAHLTLFHHLPGAHEREIVDAARSACGDLGPFALEADGWMNLGRGVAARYRSDRLDRLYQDLSRTWSTWLTSQDRQRLRPHVTIQNKVAPSAARELLRSLEPCPPPPCRVEGLSIWRYLGGPWCLVAECPFARRPQ